MYRTLIPNLFLDQESSDVQLRVETTDVRQRRVPAHSLVLRFTSKVFRTMLDFKGGQTGIVDLKVKGNMEDAICFLRYLYTRELEQVDLSVYIALLQTAHLYDVEDLVKLCNERIVGAVTPLTVCRTYEILKEVASGNLLVRCKDFMLDFAFLIFRKDLHLFLSKETMSFLLGSDKLNVLDEEQALGALWRWGYTCQALEFMSEEEIDKQIEIHLPLLREPLIKDVNSHSPWFALWEDFKSRIGATDVGDCDPTTKTDIRTRQPTGKFLNRFYEVAYISRFADQIEKVSALERGNCLMDFSVDRDILLSGLTMQVEVCQKLTSQYTFQLFVNHVKVSQLDIVDELLVNQRTNIKIGPHGQYSQQSSPYEIMYTYDLLIHFRTPVLLEKTVFNTLTIEITPNPQGTLSLVAWHLRKGTVLHFDGSVRFRAQNKTLAVSQIRYFA